MVKHELTTQCRHSTDSPWKVAVRREVWARDETGRGFVGEDGRSCKVTTANLGLPCRAHDADEADRDCDASSAHSCDDSTALGNAGEHLRQLTARAGSRSERRS